MHINIYVCIHTYIHTYILVYINIYLHTYLHTYIHTYCYRSSSSSSSSVLPWVWQLVLVILAGIASLIVLLWAYQYWGLLHTYVHTYIHIHTYTILTYMLHKCIRTFTSIHIFIYLCCIHPHTYIHTYILTYMTLLLQEMRSACASPWPRPSLWSSRTQHWWTDTSANLTWSSWRTHRRTIRIWTQMDMLGPHPIPWNPGGIDGTWIAPCYSKDASHL